VFVAAAESLVGIFSRDAAVIATGATLLLVAAVFQLFDGTQAVATGILRGAGDTRRPMTTNLIGHWALGLPVSYVLCFYAGWGVFGLWVGLCAGLMSVALVLVYIWGSHAGSGALRPAADAGLEG
jgi:MATE family multidrug resistance protein